MKTEHAGAKNGGGHWGTRAEAKRLSRKHRRVSDRRAVRYESAFGSPVWCSPEQAEQFAREDSVATRALADLR